MFYIDPDGPIDTLRTEMLGAFEKMSKHLSLKQRSEIYHLLKTDDGYVRFTARRLVESAKKHGKKVERPKPN